jgi:hypothetical protein
MNYTKRLKNESVLCSVNACHIRSFEYKFVTMLFACQFLMTCSISLAFATWATILLSNNGSSNTTDRVFAYMITDCIVNYIRAIESVTSIRHALSNTSKVNYMGSCLGIGMLIWNCVLLFRDIGIDRISENPYSMYIFVSFIVNMIAVGISVCILFITGCCMGYMICMEKEKETPNTNVIPPDTNPV